VTTEDHIDAWAEHTIERVRSQKCLMEMDVEIMGAGFAGHRYARKMAAGVDGDTPLRRDRWSDTGSAPLS
jgi:hypothetical protein